MGFFDFFKKLFKKEEISAPAIELRTIDVTERGLLINGEQLLDLPVHIDIAKKVLGSPRGVEFKTDKESREFLEQMNGKGTVTKRVNYTWDALGLYCYTDNGTVINSFGIRLSMQADEYKYTPKCCTPAVVTVGGKPWFELLHNAEDMEFFRRCKFGPYSIVSEYIDPFEDHSSRNESSYADLEISV